MPVDFQQIHNQVKKFGESAVKRSRELEILYETAWKVLANNDDQIEYMRDKVNHIVEKVDNTLRCAIPIHEPLTSHYSLPALPQKATIIAVDGSQISPDRHAQVNYCLVNVGSIQITLGEDQNPVTSIETELYYDEKFYRNTGIISDSQLALERDLLERKRIAILAKDSPPPIVTFTDGPLELWGGQDRETSRDYQKALDEYIAALEELEKQDVVTCGYVDKPGANLLVRLLEVLMTPEEELSSLRSNSPLKGVTDRDLFTHFLLSGERSAIFAIQFKSASTYKDDLALHFFYLNVGYPNHPWIVRVEIPKWVADDKEQTDLLHAVLVAQSRILGNRPYPYLLHRAHEVAVVTRQEKEQITQMLTKELMERHVPIGEISYKQAIKNLQGRTRYEK